MLRLENAISNLLSSHFVLSVCGAIYKRSVGCPPTYGHALVFQYFFVPLSIFLTQPQSLSNHTTSTPSSGSSIRSQFIPKASPIAMDDEVHSQSPIQSARGSSGVAQERLRFKSLRAGSNRGVPAQIVWEETMRGYHVRTIFPEELRRKKVQHVCLMDSRNTLNLILNALKS